MLLSLGDLQKARYVPELLPYTAALNIPAGGATFAFDARRWSDWLFVLDGLAVDQHPNVAIRIYRDDEQRTYAAAALRNLEPEPFWFPASMRLGVELVNLSSTAISGYRIRFGIWAMKATVAQRLRYGVPIPPEDQALVQQVQENVQRGVLPLSLAYLLDREYVAHALAEEIVSRAVNVAANTDTVITTVNPKRGEVVILRAVSCTPSTQAQNLRVVVDRDGQAGYVSVDAFVMASATQEMSLWVPATNELRVYLRADAPLSNVQARLRLLSVPITQILAARWGVNGAQLPEDVTQKVRAGVL